MNKFWDRIDAMLQRYAPELFKSMKPAATIEQIAAAEATMGITLPDDLRAAYLRHNGCYEPRSGYHHRPGVHTNVFLVVEDWCSLDAMVANWQGQVEGRDSTLAHYPDAFSCFEDPTWAGYAVKEHGWNGARIPVGITAGNIVVFVDLDPGADGCAGQLIFDNGCDGPSLLAPSFNAHFDRLGCLLETGALVHEADHGWVEPIGRMVAQTIWPEISHLGYPAPLSGTYISQWTPDISGHLRPMHRPWAQAVRGDGTIAAPEPEVLPTANLTAVWDRIDASLERMAPEFFKSLCPPASEAWLAKAEADAQIAFPADLSAAYLRHDGMGGIPDLRSSGGRRGDAFFPSGYWCKLIELFREVSRWRSQMSEEMSFRQQHKMPVGSCEPEVPYVFSGRYGRPVRPEAIRKIWLPVGFVDQEATTFIVLASSDGVQRGHLIDHVVEGRPKTVALGLTAHFSLLCDALESNAIVHLPPHGWMEPRSRRRVLAIYPESVLGEAIAL
jgi:cell wall assembly regulator SMI1